MLMWIAKFFGNICRVFVVLTGKAPGFAGERILTRFIKRHSQSSDTVLLHRDGIFINSHFYSLNLPVLKFVPSLGIQISLNRLVSHQDIRSAVRGDSMVDKTYYRAYGWYLLTTYGTLACNIIMAITVLRIFDLNSPLHGAFSAAWLIPNTYFLCQLFIYHFTRLKAIQTEHSFQEATPDELKSHHLQKKFGKVLSVIPVFMEEPQLIRNSLYSHGLQHYPNKHITVLLGNEFYTDHEGVLANTHAVFEIVETIQREFDNNLKHVRDRLFHLDIEKIDGYGKEALDEALERLGEVQQFIIQWFEGKMKLLAIEGETYATRDFFIRHTFQDQIEIFKAQQREARAFKDGVSRQTAEVFKTIIVFHQLCENVFDIRLNIFQRYKYTNAEHEKTKAGNLTAYLSLLGKHWHEEIGADGKFVLTVSGEMPQAPFDYVGVFDSDTILKYDYLVRKVCFLMRDENAQVGLIQSPYNVPVPEPTSSATASGIHSQWFLPMSIGLSSYQSAFWLGYNGLFRYETVKKIKGSFIAKTLIEDIETSLKVIDQGYEIITSPEYQCQTFSPPDMYSLRVQRNRWSSGGFKIAQVYLKSLLESSRSFSAREIFLRLNYILGLNMLPIAVTLTILLEHPYYREFYGIEVFPFFFYVITYIVCLKPTGYKAKHYLDGLAVSLFMNFHYLQGTWNSIKLLFKKERAQFFKSTPRSKTSVKTALGYFELFGLCFLVPYFISKQVESYAYGNFWNVYPIYQIACIVYGVYRLVGRKGFVQNLKAIVKKTD